MHELRSLYQLTLIRFRLFYREPEAIFWIFIFPIIMAIMLGIAFKNRPADLLPVGATTQALADDLRGGSGLKPRITPEQQGRQELANGSILLLAIQGSDGVVYRYDDTNPDARLARLLSDRAIQTAAGQQQAVHATIQTVHEVGTRYIDFVVPGLLGMNVMGAAMWGVGFAIVESRQKQLLKRLIASPMPRSQYLLSYIISRLVMLVIEVSAFLGFARLAYGIPFRGSLWQLSLLCVLITLSFSALGLLVASRAKTMEAVSGIMNLVLLPMWVLSGVFFSTNRFPAFLQPVIQLLPLTAAIRVLRGNMLQGMALSQMSSSVILMVVWLLITFAIALKIFRWQ